MDLFPTSNDNSLMTSHAWWEKRRLAYNIIIGLCGMISLLLQPDLQAFDPAAAILFIVLANMFYCLGFFAEIGSRYYFKTGTDAEGLRANIFRIGLGISMTATLLLGIWFSLFIH